MKTWQMWFLGSAMMAVILLTVLSPSCKTQPVIEKDQETQELDAIVKKTADMMHARAVIVGKLHKAEITEEEAAKQLAELKGLDIETARAELLMCIDAVKKGEELNAIMFPKK
jgi:hypothetical protein